MRYDIWNQLFDSICNKEGTNFIQFLLNAGLPVNALNKYGKTMLSEVAESGNMEITEFLVKKGANVNVANSDGSNPLHYAAASGQKDIVKFLLNSGVSPDCCDNNNRTALHYVSCGFPTGSVGVDIYQDIVRILVDCNADMNAVDVNGRTPLSDAALSSRKHIVELLIELGANIHCCDEDQWTVLHHICQEGWTDIVRFLLDGSFDIDVNARTSDGYTPVALAADLEHKHTVELLLKSGANVDCRDRDQYTALHYSCQNGWIDTVKHLVVKGWDINAKNDFGMTPLFLAAVSSNYSIVEYLIDSGADVGVCNLNGTTVLHYACRKGWLVAVKSLIKKGSDLNAQNCERCTPLHWAVYFHQTEVIEHLLEAGADWNLKTNSGKTAFNQLIQSSFCNLEDIVPFIKSGAYFKCIDYEAVVGKPLLKKIIFQDMKLCTQAVINKFNNADLTKLYEVPAFADRLPSIQRLKIKIASHENVIQHITETVNYEIQTKGYYDLLNANPIVLSSLCLRSLFEYYNM